MSQPLRRMPTTRGTLLMTDEPAPRLERAAWGAILAGGLVGVALMVPLVLIWRGMEARLAEHGDPALALLPLLALAGGGWSAASLSGAVRRRAAALHGVGVWALLLVPVTGFAIFAPEVLERAVPGLAEMARAANGELVLGVLALAGLFAAMLGGRLAAPRL
ncbi:hypothetical protein [Limimaricola cinnabarinus]|uniref:hypothetical protein n=1 Tax=Limimaricola cinnabarinus TaxID=1125964 RepID=UPI002490C60B|nr:hypothetical protein [Limimaricola cinnabarinus]